MGRHALQLIVIFAVLKAGAASAAITGTSGTVILELFPHPGPSDTAILAYNEKSAVPFVASQSLNFGSIDPGTLVDSHYVVFDPVTPTKFIGGGTISFDGPVIGVVTETEFLDQDLSADGAGTSDSYFGLADSLGPYPLGANPSARGLGSAEDDLIVNLNTLVLTIDSLEIPAGNGGNLDGFRVFTATVPVPAIILPFGLCVGLLVRKMRTSSSPHAAD